MVVIIGGFKGISPTVVELKSPWLSYYNDGGSSQSELLPVEYVLPDIWYTLKGVLDCIPFAITHISYNNTCNYTLKGVYLNYEKHW